MPGSVDAADWQAASDYFEKHPEKPLNSTTLQKLHRASSEYHQSLAPEVKFSYLQFHHNNDKTFQLAPGPKKPNGTIAGKGASARVKYLYDKDGKRHTVKIDNYSFAEKHPFQKTNETDISLDLGFFKAVGYRKKSINLNKGRRREKRFRYAVMDDLGESLFTYLKKHPHLSDQIRLHIAFQACFQVHQLHSGKLSKKTHRPVTHLDIKPANFYYDDTTQTLSLGDYGCAEYGPINQVEHLLKGTPNYLPYTKHSYMHQKAFKYWKKNELDIFALKRTCYCPLKRETLLGACSAPHLLPPMILTENLLKTHHLEPYFKTAGNLKNPYTPLCLAAICLLASVNKSALIPKLENKIDYQEAIIVLHFANCLDETHLQALFEDDKYVTFLNQYINRLEELPYDAIQAILTTGSLETTQQPINTVNENSDQSTPTDSVIPS